MSAKALFGSDDECEGIDMKQKRSSAKVASDSDVENESNDQKEKKTVAKVESNSEDDKLAVEYLSSSGSDSTKKRRHLNKYWKI